MSQVTHDYSTSDKWVASFTPLTNSVSEVTAELLEHSANDRESLRRIFQFITTNISYDSDAYRSGNKRLNRTSSDILHRKRAVCWGFSQLLREMCLEVGIPAFTVIGYCKPAHLKPDYDKPDHAWNIVQLEGEYSLIDATWASNIPSKREEYFLADPQHFIEDHYPVWKAFQLLTCPVTLDQFTAEEFRYDVKSETSCGYSYRDSIELYSKLSYQDQSLFGQKVAEIENPTDEIRLQYGHALFDQAMLLKETADSLLEVGQLMPSIEYYERALLSFKKGEGYAATFPWQAEAFGFAYFNYGMAVYRSGASKDQRKTKNVRQALIDAKRILNELQEKSVFVVQALDMIDQNLEVLK